MEDFGEDEGGSLSAPSRGPGMDAGAVDDGCTSSSMRKSVASDLPGGQEAAASDCFITVPGRPRSPGPCCWDESGGSIGTAAAPSEGGNGALDGGSNVCFSALTIMSAGKGSAAGGGDGGRVVGDAAEAAAAARRAARMLAGRIDLSEDMAVLER